MKAESAVSICDTFRQQSFWTWNQLRRAKLVRSQLLEETITDMNLLEIKTMCGPQVVTATFSKKREGDSGGDWEWWFTGRSKKWLSFRIQAKVLNISKAVYEHIDYAPGGRFQVERLIQSCQNATPKRSFAVFCG
jgi:hypothetical protein